MKTKHLLLPAIMALASMLSSCEDEILLEEEFTEQKTEISKTEVTVEEPVESVGRLVSARQPQSVYKSLSNNGHNRNVKLRDVRILGHMSGTVVGILEIMFLKHPCPID